MADMTKHLKRFLTDKELQAIGGEFEGVVASVTEEPIRNRFKATTSDEPVITFQEGGYRLIPNKTMLLCLIRWFGADSNDWIGRRIRLFRQLVETTNHEGVTRSKYQRALVCVDAHARTPVRRPWPTTTGTRDRDNVVVDASAVDTIEEELTADEIFGSRRQAR